MSSRSLEQAIQSAGSPVELLRDLGVGRFTRVRDQYTHWIEEQRAWQESCALADQSYHMTDLSVQGPDALDLYADYGANDFEGFDVGDAKQLVVPNPEGYLIGDAILFHTAEDEFLSVGAAPAHNWLRYHAETGDYDVDVELQRRPVATREDPNNFRFQVQGPDAVDVMTAALDGPLPDLSFFTFAEASIDGHDVRVLRHGMAGEAGFEFWGPYEYGGVVRDAVLDAGEAYGIRRMGSKSYQSANVVLGWIPLPVPAIFTGEEMRDFREWLSVRDGMLSIGGSYAADDVRDYYVTPAEIGYGHIVDRSPDHDYVGRDAVLADLESPDRRKVTLVWNPDDVTDVYGSLFDDGDSFKYMDLPTPRTSACQYDEVRADGEHVGVSKWISYVYNHRELLSLALVDTEHAEPGTEVSVVWGEANPGANPKAERHERTEVRATIAPAPYKEDRR